MDSKLSVQHGHHHHNGVSKPPVHHHGGGKRAAGGRRQGCGGTGTKGVKVVYISSPMKLTTSAEEFRAVVQELTGRDSNVADHDLDGAACYAGAPSSSSASSSSSYSSFGRVSPTGAGAAGAASAMSPTTMATANAGPGRVAAYQYAAAGMAAPPTFQGMYDQTAAGSLLYGQGQDYYW